MKYPTKLSDAVHILAFIALHPDAALTSEKIAESIRTNAAYVRQLMSALRRAGLLVSVKGHPKPALARPAEESRQGPASNFPGPIPRRLFSMKTLSF